MNVARVLAGLGVALLTALGVALAVALGELAGTWAGSDAIGLAVAFAGTIAVVSVLAWVAHRLHR